MLEQMCSLELFLYTQSQIHQDSFRTPIYEIDKSHRGISQSKRHD